MSNAAGIATRQFGKEALEYGSGDMIVTGIQSGSWIQVSGVDFGKEAAKKVEINVILAKEMSEKPPVRVQDEDSDDHKELFGGDVMSLLGKINICVDSLQSKPLEAVEISIAPEKNDAGSDKLIKFSCRLDQSVPGIHDLYFVFEGEGYEFYSWKFIK